MNKSSFLIAAIAWCILCIVSGVSDATGAAREVAHTITGVVESVHPNETPSTIMLTTRLGNKEDVLVGAFLAKNATIMRGSHRIALEDVQVGESVTMTYIKTRRGLAALSIVVGPD